jgi:hypothetical protein
MCKQEHANEFGTMGNIKIKEEPQDWSVESEFTSQNHSPRNESIFRETVLNSNKQEVGIYILLFFFFFFFFFFFCFFIFLI